MLGREIGGERTRVGRPYIAKCFCVTSLDKGGMFAGLLIQFHIHRVLSHLGTDSEIIQIPMSPLSASVC